MINNFYKRGITLMELLAVIAVLGIIFAIAQPQFSKIRENQVFNNALSDVMSSLNKARSQTLASVNSSVYGVHFESDQIVIFSGKVFSENAVDNEIIQIASPATISSIELPGGASDLYFERLSGESSATGSIIVSTPDRSKTVYISATGAVSVN